MHHETIFARSRRGLELKLECLDVERGRAVRGVEEGFVECCYGEWWDGDFLGFFVGEEDVVARGVVAREVWRVS